MKYKRKSPFQKRKFVIFWNSFSCGFETPRWTDARKKIKTLEKKGYILGKTFFFHEREVEKC